MIFFHSLDEDHDKDKDEMEKGMINKPLNKLVPMNQQAHLMDKTITQIIAEYVNDTTLETIKSNMSLSMELVDALNRTSFGMVKSCLNDSDIDVKESLKEILKLFIDSFQDFF